jgi:hypothetical protein
MSIRIGLYDFFAFTLPGIFYLIIISFWLNTLGLLAVDFSTLSDFSLAFLFLIIGAGYILGLLIDPLAYSWMRLFQSRNKEEVKVAYDEFTQRHAWVNMEYDSKDWGILLRAVKSMSLDAAADVEQHNVAAIMLRNISLGFVFSLISSLIYYFLVLQNLWILVLGVVFFMLAIAAMRRSRLRRRWFYIAIFEAFTAHFLLEAKTGKQKLSEKSNASRTKPSRKTTVEKK